MGREVGEVLWIVIWFNRNGKTGDRAVAEEDADLSTRYFGWT